MSDDLTELQPLGEDAEGAEETNEDATAAVPEIDLSKIDISKLPQVQSMQRTKDLETQTERDARRAAEQKAQQLQQQLDAVLAAVEQADPETGQAIALGVKAQALEGERDFYKEQYEAAQQQQRNQAALTAWQSEAQQAGIDPNGAEFQQAWSDAVARASSTPLEVLIQVQKALNARAPKTPAQESQENTVTTPKPAQGYMPPPPGSPARPVKQADLDAINAQLDGLMKDYTKNKDRIQQLRQQRDKAIGQ